MNVPEWLKPGLYGATVGAMAVAIVGFSWGGWQTAGAAQALAISQAERAVVAALVPVCLEQSHGDESRADTIAAIQEQPSYRQRDLVMKAGWATVPGADAPNRALAEACLASLNLEAS